MVRRTFKYRIYPTKAQVEKLEFALSSCCELYNAALQERRDAWKLNRVRIRYYDQSAQMPAIKVERPELRDIHAKTLRETLRRVDKAFQAFFRRVKSGQQPGFPRFRRCHRYNSLTFPEPCDYFRTSKLRIPAVGFVKIRLHRPLEGRTKQLQIKREAGRWYACLSVECASKPLNSISTEIGVDVGLATFATLSDGREIVNPRFYRKGQQKIRVAARKVARRKKRSNRRRKAVRLLQRANIKIKNQRADFHHKESRKLVNEFGFIAVEDLNVKGMVRGHFGKSINDAGWSAFINMLAYKAEDAGRVMVKVNPRGTSQTCLCGAEVRKTLHDRVHICTECGLVEKRDVVSAQIILGRGVRLQSLTWPVAACVG